jgi:ADP-heptose:LPS heptosyltransferase
MPSPKKILALKFRSLGDTVLMTAPLLELHRAWPQAQIQVAVLTPWAPLLQGLPGIEKIWTFERHPHAASRAKAVARLAYGLRQENFDCAVNFHASPSSATVAFASGASLRSIHFHGHRDKNRHSTVEVPGKGVLKPVIERDLDTVRALGIQVPTGQLPQVFLSDAEKDQAKAWLKARDLSGTPLLGLGLGASRPTKLWDMERFAEVAVRWVRERGGQVLAVAGPTEGALAQAFSQAAIQRIQELETSSDARAKLRAAITTETTLGIRALASVLTQCQAFCGNDSGPRHLAVAVGTPTVTIFGPEDPFEWHPYPQDRHPRLFVEGLACRKDADPGMPAWCGLNRCEIEKHRCMTGITPGAVFEELTKVTG